MERKVEEKEKKENRGKKEDENIAKGRERKMTERKRTRKDKIKMGRERRTQER